MHCITYGELVDKAKSIYPELEYVQNAIAVSTGRKLDVVRLFTSERNLPDVTSLIINKSVGECGSGFTDYFDPEQSRTNVYTFDWSEVTSEFDLYMKSVATKIIPKKRLKRPEALKAMSAHYTNNKESLPVTIKEKRESIVTLIMEGHTVEESFTLTLLKS